MIKIILTTFCQKLQCIKWIGIINLEVKYHLYRIFSFVGVRLVTVILHKKYHMFG